MLKDISIQLGKSIIDNLTESFVDNVLKERVKPVVGSVIYCELVFDTASHTGIYVGNNTIVHLDGSGDIEKVSPKVFLDRLDGFNSAISIYVSCKENNPVGNQAIANRALDVVGKKLDYNLAMNNCHKFTSNCITGDFESNGIFLLQDVKRLASEELEADNWLVWETNDGVYLVD